MNDAERLRETERWMRYARDDLHGAERFAGIEDTTPRIVCFHAQQAAEKSIKAIFVFLQVDFPFTHDLKPLEKLSTRRLASRVYGGPVRSFQMGRRAALSWRSGGSHRSRCAQHAVEQARTVYDTALEDLRSHGFTPEGD